MRRIECRPPMSGSRKSEAWSGMGIGWGITSTLVGGMATVGGLGYLLDRLLDKGSGFTALGIVLGAASAIYIVYLRYGGGGGGRPPGERRGDLGAGARPTPFLPTRVHRRVRPGHDRPPRRGDAAARGADAGRPVVFPGADHVIAGVLAAEFHEPTTKD